MSLTQQMPVGVMGEMAWLVLALYGIHVNNRKQSADEVLGSYFFMNFVNIQLYLKSYRLLSFSNYPEALQGQEQVNTGNTQDKHCMAINCLLTLKDQLQVKIRLPAEVNSGLPKNQLFFFEYI